MIEFINHKSFDREMRGVCKKYPRGYDSFASIKKLLSKRFSPVESENLIGPGKIHKIEDYIDIGGELWKVEMSVSNLRPNQWPRVWFLLLNNVIYFLHIDTHQENYDNLESTNLAKDRISDLIF
ncbi:MAG: hypothetical protein PHQ01_04265 [Candidatus Pacebacteria bacterium]|nr:hypothetical protein [Candidatus Paceibacterota bacterium]